MLCSEGKKDCGQTRTRRDPFRRLDLCPNLTQQDGKLAVEVLFRRGMHPSSASLSSPLLKETPKKRPTMTRLSSDCSSVAVSSFRAFISSCTRGEGQKVQMSVRRRTRCGETRDAASVPTPERAVTHLDVTAEALHVFLHLLFQPVRLALQVGRQAPERDRVVPELDLRPRLELRQRRLEKIRFLFSNSVSGVTALSARARKRNAHSRGPACSRWPVSPFPRDSSRARALRA